MRFPAELSGKIFPLETEIHKGNGNSGPEFPSGTVLQSDAQKYLRTVFSDSMRTNIDINESLVRKARKLTGLKTKRRIVDKALELLVRSESRKGILRYYGSGISLGAPFFLEK